MAIQRSQSTIGMSIAAQYAGGGTNSLIQAANGDFYLFWVDGTTSDVVMGKLVYGAVGWNEPVTIHTGTATALATRYDRDDGYADDYIHVAVIDSGNDDVHYYSVDTTNSDTVAGPTTIGSGTTTAGGGALSISRMRGGNLLCAWCIDAGAEFGFSRSVDTGANWTARATATGLEGATTDQWILLPGWAADNQDAMMPFWDASTDEITIKYYDDSADSWSESAAITGMVDVVATTNYPHFAATVDVTNSRNLLVAWTATDTLNADLRCWHFTESATTEVTNVVTNSTDDQGFCGIGIDTATQDWYVYYGGLSDGSDTFATSLTVNYKVSTDDGATWGSETTISYTPWLIQWFSTCPRFATKRGVALVGRELGVVVINDPTTVASGGGAPGSSNMMGGLL